MAEDRNKMIRSCEKNFFAVFCINDMYMIKYQIVELGNILVHLDERGKTWQI